MICSSVNSPKGIVQIIHGMSEHSGRYLEFANFLNNNGYIVFLSDHESHGKLAYENNKLGLFHDSFSILVKEQIKISENLKSHYPKLPLFVLGHSMGSFIGQEHIKYFSPHTAGYIIIGSCGKNKFIINLGKYLFKTIKIFTDKPRNIFNSIFFIRCNSKIKENDKNKFSWLTRDKNVVKKYMEDSLSGFSYNPNFYYEFLLFLSKLYTKDSFCSLNKATPILILSGKDDPVGLYGKGVKKLYSFYKNLGFLNLQLKLYRKSRHEILNEINKEEVYFDILEWLDKNIEHRSLNDRIW